MGRRLTLFILVGFQLTKEQYDYNKTIGIFQQ